MPLPSWRSLACAAGLFCWTLPAPAARIFVEAPAQASVINTCRLTADSHTLDGTLDSAAFFGDQAQVGQGRAQALGELRLTLTCTRGAAVSLLPDLGQHAQGTLTACGRRLQASSGEQLPYATALRLDADHGYTPSADPVERCGPQANPLTLTARGIHAPAQVALTISVLPQDVRPGAFQDQLVLILAF